jgi:DNA-binding NtrC family response regulator/tetratricopeptide (TPR) repeat protein/class 3 adenylate cyclase
VPHAHPTERIVGNAPVIHALRAQIRHLTAFDTVGNAFVPTLLLQGETGTGKGLVARVIHDSGPRAQGPFIEVNCAAIPETLLEVELFGFEAGTFTDAKRAKPGLVESASHGTLFLDEIDALPLLLQGKLLSTIDEKRVRRLGAVESRRLDVKFIAATQTDLSRRVTEGHFRPDLYHRLAVVILEIPPLRERGEDILVLAQHFVRQYAAAHGLLPKQLSRDAEAWLRSYDWSGNVRELSHLMERVTLLSTQVVVNAPTLEQMCLPRPLLAIRTGTPPVRDEAAPLDELARLRQALGQTGGNVVRAARLLGISRGTLRYWMRRYGIGRPSWQALTPPHGSRPQEASEPFEADRSHVTSVDVPALDSAWEQKPVVVLTIDVAWPEAMESNVPRVEPWTLALRWHQTLTEQVQGFGGLIAQLSPSSLTAVFGIPQTLEQMPQRAVQTALAIRCRMAEARAADSRQPGPEVRMAIHRGQVLIDVQASNPTARLLPLGETLSLPVRLLGHAAPGDILLSPQVGRLVEGWFELHEREGPVGAGISNGVRAYAVVGLGPRCSPLEVYGKRPLSRFVGRERELAALRDLLAQVAQGRGQVVGIVGEPGVGKSRLCYELTQSQRPHRWLILESSPVAYGKEIPYLPVIDLLKVYFQLDAHDERRTIRDKVMGKLRTLDEGFGSTLPAFLALLDVPVEAPQWQALDPPQRRQRTLEACRRLLLQESQVQPLVLVVENLHWIDTETQAFLDGLVDSLPPARILLLVNYRPEYHHGWGGKTYYTQLRLDPLSSERADELLRVLLGEDASLAPLRQLLIARTEGNPFFLEESVRTLVEMQALVGEPGAYRLVQALPTMQVPTTVQAVLAVRLDRLPPEDKRLLQMAAVIGHEVPWALLQAIAEVPEESLECRLAHLQAAEFLYGTRLFPERAFTFKHALTHEVAYGSLVQERRRMLHARIVEAIEALAGDRVSDQLEHLARHALRGEVWDKALVYCRQAGEKALARSARREAVGYFEQALSALPHLQETHAIREQAIDLRLALRVALFLSGSHRRILACLREAESLAAALDDPRRLAQVLCFLSSHFRFMGAYDQSIATAQRALALAIAGREVVLQAVANRCLGLVYETQGDYRRAIDCLRQTMGSIDGARHHERLGQVNLPAVQSRAWLAMCHAELGLFAEGMALGAEGLRIAEAVAHPGSLMFASWAVGRLVLRQGDLPRALPRLERALSICQEANLPFYFPEMAAALGAAYTLDGRVADAVPLLTQALEQSTAGETVVFRALCCLSLGEAQLLASSLEEAHALAEHTLALTRRHQERGHQAYALRLLGDIAARRQPPESARAETHYRQALALADELGMRPLQAHCHAGLGTLYARSGQREQARTALTRAIEMYRGMDMTFWLPQTEAALAKVSR